MPNYDDPGTSLNTGKPIRPVARASTEPATRARIEELIEASSLGTPEAKAMRERTPPEVARKIVERAHQLGQLRCPHCAELGHTDCHKAGIQEGREQAARDIESWIGAYDDPSSTDAERDVAHGLRHAADVARTGKRP